MSQVDENLTTATPGIAPRSEENRPLENSQEIRDNPGETKIAVEEKKEGDTQKIEIQSPIEAMIEKPVSASTQPEGTTEETVEKKPKRTRIYTRKERLDSQSTLPETSDQQEKKTEKTEIETAELDNIPQPYSVEEQKISNKGIAHYRENVIKIAGGFKIHSGDEMKIGDREFELRRLEPSQKPFYWGALALGIVILFFIFQFNFTGYKDSGKIVGVVIDKGTGTFIPNALIELKDLGKKVHSNDLGFFILDALPAGTYELQAQFKGFKPSSENAVVVKKQITTTLVELTSESEGVLPIQISSVAKRTEPQTKPGTPNLPSVLKSQLGSIKIESNVPGVIVFLDGEYLGVGNNVYSDITPGSHNLRLAKDNYQDWTGNVTIKEKKTSGIKANLTKIETSPSSALSSKGQTDYFASAQKEFDAGNFAGAVENYNRSLLMNSDNPEAYLGRGNSYLKIGDKTKALADFSQGAKLFEEKGNYNKAALCYTQTLSLTPGDLNVLYGRAQDYIKTGEYEKAVTDLKKVTEQNPKFFNGFMELANAQYYSKDYSGAVESYSQAKKLNPNSKQVYVKLALAYTTMQDKSGAKKNYEKFKELTTLIDRENMKDDPEWIKVLKFLGEETEKEF
ncbi:MAG: tetratricopeptide repeat protein [Candidatus Zixiibacteriota bacterium]